MLFWNLAGEPAHVQKIEFESIGLIDCTEKPILQWRIGKIIFLGAIINEFPTPSKKKE